MSHPPDSSSDPTVDSTAVSHTAPWLARLHLATAFLTRLPVPEVCMDSAGSLAAAMSVFPLVGAAIGAMGGLVLLLASLALPPLPSSLFAVTALILLTGALHEDGLADFADGLGARGAKDGDIRDRRLAIMRDSHTGVFGVVALVLSVLLRASLIATAPTAWAGFGAMLAAGALSRAAIPAVMLALSPARADGLAAEAGRPDRNTAIQAAIWAILAAAMGLGFGGAIAGVVGALLGAAALGFVARKSLGGYTGDVLGAAAQLAEIAVLLAAAITW